ncbi:BH3 interacting domain death agonist [Triplophysa dalaica]|uniref:BH3 interacting domain death agonist n=1 Tax=Triplophysa dalaica TaxID=1582913 RepID=UPI0024E025F5|nr:BH3 interacting domain death agonist [Triplophysa dalaica]
MSCLAMDRNKNVDSFPETSLVLLTFLQHKSCQNDLDDLNENLRWNTNHNCIESDDELQTDGHSFDYRDLLQDLQHQVQPRLPVNAEEAHAAREMAAELIRIADLLEHGALSQAADSLTKKLKISPLQVWSDHLSVGVKSLLHQVPGAREFNKELVEMAFTFALTKTVCERVPRFLFHLYDVVVQYFIPHSPQ